MAFQTPFWGEVSLKEILGFLFRCKTALRKSDIILAQILMIMSRQLFMERRDLKLVIPCPPRPNFSIQKGTNMAQAPIRAFVLKSVVSVTVLDSIS